MIRLRRSVKIHTYTHIEEALASVNAQDHGRYFLCTCPECHHHEAFLYKNNPNFLQCNRENECGVSVAFHFKEKQSVDEIKTRHEAIDPEVTPEQRRELEFVTRVLNYIQFHTVNDALKENYRGLSRDTTRPFVLDLKNEEFVENLFRKAPNLFYSRKALMKTGKKVNYADIKDMTKRNLVFPIYGNDGLVDRILLRSSIEPNLSKKEIQLQVNPKSTAKDFFKDIPSQATHIVIGESIIDAMSFREIDPSVGLYGMTGSRKWRRVIEDIQQHKEDYKDKIFIIATDDDKAGMEAKDNLTAALDKEQLAYKVFSYDIENINDPNEYLQRDREAFSKSYEALVHNELPFNLPKQKQQWTIDRLYRNKREGVDQTTFSFSYEGLRIRDITVDLENKTFIYPSYGNEYGPQQVLMLGERIEHVLTYIAKKAPPNKEYRHIVLPAKTEPSVQEDIQILSYKREINTTIVDIQVGEVCIRNIKVQSQREENPIIHYPPPDQNPIHPLISGSESFNKRLLDGIKNYEKSARRAVEMER
ncbi:toprim domain-containing protein [Paenibacillus larvae]